MESLYIQSMYFFFLGGGGGGISLDMWLLGFVTSNEMIYETVQEIYVFGILL